MRLRRAFFYVDLKASILGVYTEGALAANVLETFEVIET